MCAKKKKSLMFGKIAGQGAVFDLEVLRLANHLDQYSNTASCRLNPGWAPDSKRNQSTGDPAPPEKQMTEWPPVSPTTAIRYLLRPFAVKFV
jgi:hypothetical protein